MVVFKVQASAGSHLGWVCDESPKVCDPAIAEEQKL
jgi:hypothetical protein